MEKAIQFIQTTPEQLASIIASDIKKDLKAELSLIQQPQNEELFTRAEACEFLKIDSSTLWAWTNQGKIICQGIGSRRYYLKSELLKCLTPLKK